MGRAIDHETNKLILSNDIRTRKYANNSLEPPIVKRLLLMYTISLPIRQHLRVMRRPPGKWNYNSTARSRIWMGSDSSRLLLLVTNWAGNSFNADCNRIGKWTYNPMIKSATTRPHAYLHCTRHTYYMFKDLFEDGLYIFTDSTVVHHMEDTGKVFWDDACYR